jgi:perosamine synthetase
MAVDEAHPFAATDRDFPSATNPWQRRLLVRPLLSQTPMARSADRSRALGGASLLAYRARAALWHGIRAVGLRPGDRVLFPAYCCGAELDVLLKSGLTPIYYPVDASAEPDLHAIESLFRKGARALFLIHYFGLTIPIASLQALARQHGALVIEDCAHALYALDEHGRNSGTGSDLAVFSLSKHLPAPNGGIAVLPGARRFSEAPPLRRPSIDRRAKSLAYTFAAELELRLPSIGDALRHWIGRPKSAIAPIATDSDAAFFFHPEEAGWQASSLSRLVAALTDGPKVRELRCRNYAQLAAILNGDGPQPVRRTFAAGSSPFVFPVLSDAPSALRRHLFQHGFETLGPWRRAHPAVPAEGFAEEERLRAQLVGLPVHHGLRPAEIARLGELIRRWRSPHDHGAEHRTRPTGRP